jgi:hypothetical protein
MDQDICGFEVTVHDAMLDELNETAHDIGEESHGILLG